MLIKLGCWQALQKRRQKSKLRTWEHLVLGGFSGACAATVTTPLDVAKTKLQCGVRAPLHEILRQTLEKRGPAGLFAGMVRPSHGAQRAGSAQPEQC